MTKNMQRSVNRSRRRLNIPVASRGFALVMGMRATQERHLVEHVLLEPFKPQVNHRRHKQRDQLRENQAADDYKTQWPARCSVLAESERNGDCAHERGESCHHDRSKPFHAGFVNRRPQIPAFVNSLQRKINDHDSVFLHYA